MIRVNQIWKHPIYQEQLQALQMLEADRKFCRHTPEHFLDVARLAYIHALESHASASKELIYCTALLHDIGRAEQYRFGICLLYTSAIPMHTRIGTAPISPNTMVRIL